MRNLTLKMHISLHEGSELHSISPLSSVHSSVIIPRGQINDEFLRGIIDNRITTDSIELSGLMLGNIKIPLDLDTAELRNTIVRKLEEQFPNLSFGAYIHDSKFTVYTINNKEISSIKETHIYHPFDKMILTTRYHDIFVKLEDGTWTNLYQGHDFYEGIVQRVPAPIDEILFNVILNSFNIPYEIQLNKLTPLPEPKEGHNEDGSNNYNEYGF